MLSIVDRAVVDSLLQSTAAITKHRHHARMESYRLVHATKTHDASSTQSSSDNDLAKSHDFALIEKIRKSLKYQLFGVATFTTDERRFVFQ